MKITRDWPTLFSCNVIVRAGLALFKNVTDVWNYTFQFLCAYRLQHWVLSRAWAKWRQLKECIWQRFLCLSKAGLVRYFRLLKNSIMGDAGAFISAAAEAMISSTACVTSLL